MSVGLERTFCFLAKTENEAAVDILTAALDSSAQVGRDRAVRTLLDRRSPAGHYQVFRRLLKFDERSRAIINERPERLVRAAAEAIGTKDKATCAAAFDAILSFRLYNTLPALLGVLKDRNNPEFAAAARTVLKLIELFYAEISDPEQQAARNDLDTLRRRITFELEGAVRKVSSHGCREVVEAFLLVAKHQNVTLRSILQDPRDRGHQALVEVLSSSAHGGVIRLLLGFLEDPQLPRAAARVLASRSDLKFVENLLWRVGPRPSRSAAETLKRIDSFAWAKPKHALFAKLDDDLQRNAVRAVAASSMKPPAVLKLLGFLLTDGKPGGRRAAAEALADFQGSEAAVLVVKALNDEDPVVRGHLARQLRPRQIPGAMSLLIRMVDSPHEEVREALRDALPEFTFDQFLANFDSMPAELLPTTGHLVSKIDPDPAPRLAAEMEHLSPVRRRRAVLAAGAMGLVRGLEPSVIELLSDEDHMVRIAAAKTLADCGTMPTWEALRDALLDRSVIVQEAAEQSLNRISQTLGTLNVPEEAEEQEEQEVAQ